MSITEEPTDVVLRDGVYGDPGRRRRTRRRGVHPARRTVVPQVGDIAFEVGFLVSGAVDLLLRRTMR
jgi:hypothetical protein